MEIMYCSRELDPNARYQLTVQTDSRPITEAIGVALDVDTLCIVKDADKRSGEIREFVKILTSDGYVYTTGGATVMRQVHEAVDYIRQYTDWRIARVTITTRRSKGGRDYYNAEIVFAPASYDPAPTI